MSGKSCSRYLSQAFPMTILGVPVGRNIPIRMRRPVQRKLIGRLNLLVNILTTGYIAWELYLSSGINVSLDVLTSCSSNVSRKLHELTMVQRAKFHSLFSAFILPYQPLPNNLQLQNMLIIKPQPNNYSNLPIQNDNKK